MGYGNKEEEFKIRQAVSEEGMEGRVVILGKRNNPYPYLKNCDFYVQPSRYEGKSVTVKEAQIFGKPVIIRNYPTAQSQIENGVDGFIGSFELDEFARDLWKIISNSEAISKVTGYLQSRSVPNDTPLRDFFSAVLKD